MLLYIDVNDVLIDCLSFTVRSTWGHFKRVGRSVTKQTCRILSRTTVAGMLAAIVGADCDSYYDVFGVDNSATAVTLLSDLRTVSIPTTGLGIDPKQDVAEAAGSWWTYKLIYQNMMGDRQFHSYEVLVDPAYRTDIALEDGELYNSLREHLVNGTLIYPPSLGKSKYLAVIEDVEVDREPEVRDIDRTLDIGSVVPISLFEAILQGKVTYGVEWSPTVMVRESEGCRTTRPDDCVYAQQASNPVRTDEQTDAAPVQVGDRAVIFR